MLVFLVGWNIFSGCEVGTPVWCWNVYDKWNTELYEVFRELFWCAIATHNVQKNGWANITLVLPQFFVYSFDVSVEICLHAETCNTDLAFMSICLFSVGQGCFFHSYLNWFCDLEDSLGWLLLPWTACNGHSNLFYVQIFSHKSGMKIVLLFHELLRCATDNVKKSWWETSHLYCLNFFVHLLYVFVEKGLHAETCT